MKGRTDSAAIPDNRQRTDDAAIRDSRQRTQILLTDPRLNRQKFITPGSLKQLGHFCVRSHHLRDRLAKDKTEPLVNQTDLGKDKTEPIAKQTELGKDKTEPIVLKKMQQ